MDETLVRMWSNLADRLHGPFAFRFVLQPMMAVFYATRDGLQDARHGRPAYFWSILSHPGEREALLREGWRATARVIGVAAAIDAIYQVIVFGWIYPGELMIIVLTLAFVPY